MDHFAKPNDDLTIAQEHGELQRNFQGYATHGNCDMLAMGVSSISAIDNIFVQNFKDIPAYSAALDQGLTPINKGIVLSEDDLIRQTVINQLICNFEVKFADMGRKLNIDFCEYFADELDQLAEFAVDGLIKLTPSYLKVTDDGRLLIRRICMAFDAYLNPNRAQAVKMTNEVQPVRYSKII
jgi:oxygen-independent coproporphyrinogen-3 oxidase